ncbi:MAG: hypothetical protein KAT48_10655 [Bacteroidales bacterium]|nr:hypothetical protein [Bacteroidales bacterium]
MKAMKVLLITVFFVSGLMLSSSAQQWAGPSNTTDPIGRTGNVGVGVTNPEAKLSVVMQYGFNSIFRRVNNEWASNSLFLLQRARGTIGSESPVQNGDRIGQIRFEGYHGAGGGGYGYPGIIICQVDGALSGTTVPGNLQFWTTNTSGSLAERMIIKNDGNVGIGTTNPQTILAVNGNITCKEVEVTLTGWSDYVFDEKYNLRSLEDVEHFIMTNGHLPDVPSAKEVESNGFKLGEMDATLLKKIEELTLHVIELNKRIKTLEEK